MDPHQLFRAIVALNALFASLAWYLARPTTASMLSVLTFAAIWPFVDKPLGGRTILVLDDINGVTTGDLLSVLAVVIVGVRTARHQRKRRRNRVTAAGTER